MDVYFEGNFWDSLREENGKKPVKVLYPGTRFTWKGRAWQIPAVYVYEEGVTADFCGSVEPEEIRTFYEKWGDRNEERLSETEREELSRENPFDMDFRVEAQINEEKASGQGGCGTSFCPPHLRPGDEAAAPDPELAEEMLMDAYALDPGSGWLFWRSSFAWPKSRPEVLHSLRLTFTEAPVRVSGPHFRSKENRTGQTVEFVHPKTGRTHVLTVLGQESESLPDRTFPPETEIERWPMYFQILYYQVEPALSDEEALTVCDCAWSDTPVYKKQLAASSAAVIGGADGPTSVFFAGKQTDSGTEPERRTAYSSLHYMPEKTVEWKIVFQVDDEETKEVLVEL